MRHTSKLTYIMTVTLTLYFSIIIFVISKVFFANAETFFIKHMTHVFCLSVLLFLLSQLFAMCVLGLYKLFNTISASLMIIFSFYVVKYTFCKYWIIACSVFTYFCCIQTFWIFSAWMFFQANI